MSAPNLPPGLGDVSAGSPPQAPTPRKRDNSVIEHLFMPSSMWDIAEYDDANGKPGAGGAGIGIRFGIRKLTTKQIQLLAGAATQRDQAEFGLRLVRAATAEIVNLSPVELERLKSEANDHIGQQLELARSRSFS